MKSWLNRSFSQGARFLLAFYQIHLGGFLGGVCRFEPSCSHYARQAFDQFSPGFALQLTIRRLLRCHPFSSCSCYDPVPSAGREFGRRSN